MGVWWSLALVFQIQTWGLSLSWGSNCYKVDELSPRLCTGSNLLSYLTALLSNHRIVAAVSIVGRGYKGVVCKVGSIVEVVVFVMALLLLLVLHKTCLISEHIYIHARSKLSIFKNTFFFVVTTANFMLLEQKNCWSNNKYLLSQQNVINLIYHVLIKKKTNTSHYFLTLFKLVKLFKIEKLFFLFVEALDTFAILTFHYIYLFILFKKSVFIEANKLVL